MVTDKEITLLRANALREWLLANTTTPHEAIEVVLSTVIAMCIARQQLPYDQIRAMIVRTLRKIDPLYLPSEDDDDDLETST